MRHWTPLLALALAIACGHSGSPPPPPGGTFSTATVVTGLTQPTAMALVPDGRGRPFSDGKRYLKFYVPLGRLKLAGDL